MCDSTHVIRRGNRLDFLPMEWVLQVADEFDDACSALRHGWLGINAEFGALSIAGIGIGAVVAALALR